MTRFLISMPDAMLKDLDAAARREQRSRSEPSGQSWRGHTIGATDPNSDCILTVEACRPGVAKPVRGAGFVGDLAGFGVVGWRSVAENIRHVPGSGW